MRSAHLWDDTERALVIAAFRDLEKCGVGRRRSQPRGIVIVNVARNADISPSAGVGLVLAQDFSDARDFPGADEQVDFREFRS